MSGLKEDEDEDEGEDEEGGEEEEGEEGERERKGQEEGGRKEHLEFFKPHLAYTLSCLVLSW